MTKLNDEGIWSLFIPGLLENEIYKYQIKTLIISGDHIYKMDYSKMLNYHREKDADVSISVIEVPWEEASRFGIMNTNEDLDIIEFEEKPKEPKSNLASMGIYIFKWSVLRTFLEMDDKNPQSTNDFGKDIIPLLLEENKKVVAYPFKGYWKDVGTVGSLWEANMDLLKEGTDLDLYDRGLLSLQEWSWRIMPLFVLRKMVSYCLQVKTS